MRIDHEPSDLDCVFYSGINRARLCEGDFDLWAHSGPTLFVGQFHCNFDAMARSNDTECILDVWTMGMQLGSAFWMDFRYIASHIREGYFVW